MLLEFPNSHSRVGEYLWPSQTPGLPGVQPPWSHMLTSYPESWGDAGHQGHMLHPRAALPASTGGGRPQTDMPSVVVTPRPSVPFFLHYTVQSCP